MKYREAIDRLDDYHPGVRVPGLVKLSSNENPLGPSPLGLQAARDALADLAIYPDGSGMVLRQALASRYGISEEMILLGNGSDEILGFAAGLLIEPGDEAISAATTFSQYRFSTTVFGGVMRECPLDDKGRFDLGAIELLVTPATKIIYICNPNNPTGTYVGIRELEDLIRRVDPRILIVVDEAYGEYADMPDYPNAWRLASVYPNLLVTRTFSKLYGLAGLRIGYGIANAELARALSRLKPPFNINGAALAAATAALSDADHVARSLANNVLARERLGKLLDELGLPYYPTQANFVCCDLRELRADGSDIRQAFANAGVTIRLLDSFGLPGWIRITLGTPEQLALVETGLRTLCGSAAQPGGRSTGTGARTAK